MNFGSLDSLDERAGASVPLRDAEAYDTSVQAVALQGCQLIPLRCTSGAFRRSIFLWSFRFSSSANRRSDLQFAKSTDVVWAHHCERPNVPNGRTADLFIFPRRCGQSILFFDVYFFSCFRDSLFLVLARPKLLPPPPKKNNFRFLRLDCGVLKSHRIRKKKAFAAARTIHRSQRTPGVWSTAGLGNFFPGRSETPSVAEGMAATPAAPTKKKSTTNEKRKPCQCVRTLGKSWNIFGKKIT